VIAVVDYGAGNLRSVSLALMRTGAAHMVTDDAEAIACADGVILPGVGAFGDAMCALENKRLVEPLRRAAADKPFLGICLGMQMLFERSEESPGVGGLALLEGIVRRLPEVGLKIPQMGWNKLERRGEHVYFVHSYMCVPEDAVDIADTVDYGVPVVAVVRRGNLVGMQFHPEKSGAPGEQLLKEFVALC